jgi:putative oxidoreductase
MKFLKLGLSLVCAIILFQTLFFKFTGAEESIYIFQKLGVEPWGRWFSGVVELIAGMMLLIPTLRVLGALVASGIMAGAILSHLTVLGVVVQDDGGLLFTLALVVFFSSLVLVWLEKVTLLAIYSKLLRANA